MGQSCFVPLRRHLVFTFSVAIPIPIRQCTLVSLLCPRKQLLRSIVMSTSVCVSVCLSVRKDISGTTRAIFTHFCACCLWPWLGPPQRGRAVWVFFFPIKNALYSRAFETHTKTAKLTEMPFGVMSGLGPRNSVLRGGDDPRRGGEVLGETCLTILTPL